MHPHQALIDDVVDTFQRCFEPSKMRHGDWRPLHSLVDKVVTHAKTYEPLITYWFTDLSVNLEWEWYRLIKTMDDSHPDRRLPSQNFWFAMIAGQLVSPHTPVALLDAITGHEDFELVTAIAAAGRELRTVAGGNSLLLRQDFRNCGLSGGQLKRLLDANGLWGRSLIDYALRVDDGAAAKLYAQTSDFENLLSPLYALPQGACPDVRMHLFGFIHPNARELLRRMELALSNTNPDPEHLRSIDFDPVLSPEFLQDNYDRVSGLLSEFCNWGCDTLVARKTLKAMDEAGFDWGEHLSKNNQKKQWPGFQPHTPEGITASLKLCLQLFESKPQVSALFAILRETIDPAMLLESLKGSDDLLLSAYKCTGDVSFVREVIDSNRLASTLEEDLGL